MHVFADRLDFWYVEETGSKTMAGSKAEKIRDLERELYLERSGSAPREMDVPRILPAGSSDLTEWRKLIAAIGAVSRGGHAVNDVRTERRG
jgi:hypothetical protein